MQFYFENYVLDPNRRELRRSGNVVSLEPQVFDVLVFLVKNRDRVIRKEELLRAVWGGRIVSESTLTSRINAARKAVADTGEDQRLIRTLIGRGIRFVGAVREEGVGLDPSTLDAAQGIHPPLGGIGAQKSAQAQEYSVPRQSVRYCTTTDGVRLAYAQVGSGPPLVRSAHWLTHLEYDWESPIRRHLLLDLTRDFTLLRYDPRGSGLSDWSVSEMSLEAWVSDLEAVVDAAGFDRFPLIGFSQGCAVSIAFAARYPERVSHLILYGGFATGRMKRPNVTDADRKRYSAMKTLMKLGWGANEPTFRQLFTSMLMPAATRDQADAFNELQRLSTSPEGAVRYFETVSHFDIRHLLPSIETPTLVLHVRGDITNPIDFGRELAAGIRNSRFVALSGHNHVPLENDSWKPLFLAELRSFIRES